MTDEHGMYSGRHLAFLVPTKDRPAKIANLLDSLVAQPEPCGRIVIVDGGQSIRATNGRLQGGSF